VGKIQKVDLIDSLAENISYSYILTQASDNETIFQFPNKMDLTTKSRN
jgi:hypothetical protein